ncbi:hypothetical protein KRR55_08795 [Paeniglutamicibacter sp. ABSL32-1]|uniref:hypothetical protein n=1 Tax=Paeniglutamicibacter quisquiliarum TaxID=2849498 RepID=UPI001C2D4083|nr:hypothetical protein [Paeniglutamicibacter quisquiliarum]MBV1779209.1 hypothetical protein [Paeniglutamicibacter quisquiliarum]
MFLQDLGFALLRRWYFVLFGVLVTVAGVFGIYQVVPVSYQATASLVLVPPQTAVIEGENPYLYMGALDQALSVLVVKMNSAQVSEPILQKDPNLSYALTKDVATTGPIILIESEAPVDTTALSIVNQVLKQVPPNLVEIQDALGVPKDARITAMTIVQNREAEEVTKKQQRMMIAGAAGGLALTVLVTGLMDKLLTRRKQKRMAKRKVRAVAEEHPIEAIQESRKGIQPARSHSAGGPEIKTTDDGNDPERDVAHPAQVTQSTLIES